MHNGYSSMPLSLVLKCHMSATAHGECQCQIIVDSTGRMLWDSSKVMATRGVADAVAVAPGTVVLGATAEVVVEEGSNLGLLGGGAVSWSSSSSSFSLLDSPKATSNKSHTLGTGPLPMASVKFA